MTKAEQTLTPDQAIAALERAADYHTATPPLFDEEGESLQRDAAILRALAAALREAEHAYSDTENKEVLFSNGQPLHDYWRPVWIVPAPRIEP